MKQVIFEKLNQLSDEKYALFCKKLIPTYQTNKILGVKAPLLKLLAKELKNSDKVGEFLCALPHCYLEENNLHAFIICFEKDFQRCLKMLNEFLPYVDNWSTCDSLRPKALMKNKAQFLTEIQRWILSDKPYIIRFAIEMLMTYFLDKEFLPEYLELVASVKSEEYYVKMMIAWYFATALAKQYDSAIKFIKEKRLDAWVHNKTIQKAVESFRINDNCKNYLKTLKVK